MNNTVKIELSPFVEISDVVNMMAKLKNSVKEEGANIVLCAGAVERIDTASLQLLASFISYAQAHNFNVSWDSVSEQAKRAAWLTGMNDNLLLAEA